MEKIYAGMNDMDGNKIYSGDVFHWSLPGHFNTGASPIDILDFIVDLPPGVLSNDFEEIALVEKKDGEWVLVGLGDNDGWESLLDGEFADGTTRNQHGRVIGNIRDGS